MEGWPRNTSAYWSDSVLHEFKSPTIKKYFGVDTWDEFVESFSKPIAESRCGLDGEFVKAAENLKEVLTSLPPNLHHYLRGQHWRKARPVEQIRWLRDIDGNPVFDEEIFWENWKTGTKYDKIIERMRQDLPLVEATLKAAQKDLKDLEKEIEQKINDTYNVDEHLRGK
tara:strand:+ start:39 stop:545 length:507 start_codon:yes stop_codon:yes gene_type:complete